MRPYRRLKRVTLRTTTDFKIGRLDMRTVDKARQTVLMDIKKIWSRDPPFPASMRILISLTMVWLFLLPMLYLLIPPVFTILSVMVIKNENLSSVLAVPTISREERRDIYYCLSTLIKKAMYRLSMVVTLYDYVQTFRAIGIINLDEP